MLRWLAVALAITAAALDTAAAKPVHRTGPSASGGALMSGAGQDRRAPFRSGGSGVTSSPAAGAYAPPHSGGHENSGWYQRGFGGTLNPGWGYNFGPNLGGLGR
jgi:hypothetical protein